MSYLTYTEIFDHNIIYEKDPLIPPGSAAADLKDYRLRLLDREKGYRYSINLTIFIMAYPLPKIYKLIKFIVDEGDKENGIKALQHIYECIDYLSKTKYNETKSFHKKLQRINDRCMYMQSLGKDLYWF
jgi:hypothetical protein